MPQTQNRAVMNWLILFAFIVAFLIVFGGFVRLTRSGLSIVEWNPVSGTVPPLGESAWQEEFAKYQQTPEFQQINFNMTLGEYRYIFWIEWIHASSRALRVSFMPSLFLFPVQEDHSVEGIRHLLRDGNALHRAGSCGLGDGRQRTG